MKADLSARSGRVLRALTGLASTAGLLLGLASGPASAQATAGLGGATGGFQGPISQHPLVTAGRPFQWSASTGLGAVKVPLPGQFGWTHIVGLDFQARVVPSVSTDPTIEVIVYPPASGHPTKAERLTVQFPMNPGAIRGSGAMVLGFHSYGVSEKDIFVNTQLPQLCAQRGWLLVAPYGLYDTHYGNLPSQRSLDKVLELVDLFFDWDPERIYGVGFSMGGGAATSYGMRRQAEGRLRLAGVVNHTGTVDLIGTYLDGSLALKQLMADSAHFGAAPGTPDADFEYERVSPAILSGGVVDPARASVRNLSHVPIYYHVNTNDPQINLVNDNLALAAYLQGEGANVNLVTTSGPLQHAWSTMDLVAALDWIDQFKKPDLPCDAVVFADEESAYFHTFVRSKPTKRIAHYAVSCDQAVGVVEVTGTRDLDSLVLRLDGMGFAAGHFLTGIWSAVDGTGDELVLTGYASAPSQVLFGGKVTTAWSYDPILGEVSLQLPPSAGPVIWSVTP
jgi:predicted esterase